MKSKPIIANVALVAVSVALGLLLSEFVARQALNPSDYLTVEMVPDEIMGGVPSRISAAAGFDRWGFRNREVPEAADIVAIGDSHTYGNTATMDDSWPYVLARLTGKRVYNMGLGGYGPNQYFQLLTTKALKLKPKTIIVGLYIGDDFDNAFLMTYGLQYWAALRALPANKANVNIWEEPRALSWHKKLRNWLSRNSVVYQLVFHGPLAGRFQGEMQIKNASNGSDEVVSLEVSEKNILEAFRPKRMLQILDQGSETVREGMRITFKLLADMNDVCLRNNVQFLVVVIPTKETVFADYLEHKPDIPLGEVLDKLLANERIARAKTFQFMTDAGIPYVDTLPALKRAQEKELYARTAADMHPNRNGYKVIAEAAFESLKQSQ